MSGLSLLWLLWFIIPALSLSYLASPPDRAIMSRTPPKNITSLEDSSRFIVYFLLRLGPSILLCLFMFSWAMAHSLSLSATDVRDFVFCLQRSTLSGVMPSTTDDSLASRSRKCYPVISLSGRPTSTARFQRLLASKQQWSGRKP